MATDWGVDIDGVANILDVPPATVRKYTRDLYNADKPGSRTPHFPAPDAAGLYSVAAVLAWRKALPGKGGAKGAPKPKGLYPCQRCGTEVPRRWKDPKTGEMLCKPDYLAAGEATEGDQ